MATGRAQIAGLASGMDTTSMITQLMQIERQPLVNMQNNQHKLDLKQGLISEIKTALFTLQNNAGDLTFNSVFSARLVTSSDEDIATATAGAYAVNSAMSFTDIQLAKSSSINSSGALQIPKATAAVLQGSAVDFSAQITQSGSFTINGTAINVQTSDTISDVLSKINSAGAGVTATKDAATGKITLTQTTAGANYKINLGNDSSSFFTQVGLSTTATPIAGADSGLGTVLSNLPAGSPLQATADGYFTINGVAFTVKATDSLSTIMSKINNSTAAGVSAFYDTNQDKLILTSRKTGSSANIQLGSAGDTSDFLKKAGLLAGNALWANTDGTGQGQATIGTGDGSTTQFTITDKPSAANLQSVTVGGTAYTKVDSLSGSGNEFVYDQSTGQITFNAATAPGVGQQVQATYTLAAAGQVVAATDATFKMNGLSMSSTSNTANVNGINVTFKSSGNVNLVVKSDIDSMMSKIQTFVNNYNSTLDLLNTRLTETPKATPTDGTTLTDDDLKIGLLRGESFLYDAQDDLQEIAYGTVNGTAADMNSLYQIGITTGALGSTVDSAKSGHLVIDTNKLRDALTNRPDDVARLFSKGDASVDSEQQTVTGNVIQLNNKSISAASAPVVKVLRSGSDWTTGVVETFTLTSGNPGAGQYAIDYNTGKITLGTYADKSAVADGTQTKVSYGYTVSTGSQAGIATRLKNTLSSFTRVGGTIDAMIGTSGEITKDKKDLQDQIDDMTDRLKMREDNLWTQFNAMEQALAKMKDQSNWFASMASSSSSS